MSNDNGNDPNDNFVLPLEQKLDPRHPSFASDDKDEFYVAAEQFNDLSKQFFSMFLHLEARFKEAAQLCIDMANLLDDIKKNEGVDNG